MSILMALAAQITSEPIDSGRYRLRISGSAIANVAAAQAELLPTARGLCGTQPVSFGTFRFSQNEKVENGAAARTPVTLSLEQELLCGTAKPIVEPAAILPADWQPAEADQKAVLAATYAYFAAKDRGRHGDAWSMLSNGMKRLSPAGDWSRSGAAFNEQAGAVRSRRVTEITWYNNPQGAPQPGLYVAADYSAEFEKLEFVCGYLMWLLQPDGSFKLTREEQNLLDKPTAKNLASIDRQPLRAQMGCKD